MFALILLATCLAQSAADAPRLEGATWLANWRQTVPANYVLSIGGKDTSLAGLHDGGSEMLSAVVHQTPKGFVYGFIDQTSNGAMIASVPTAFVYSKRGLQTFAGQAVLTSKGEYVLLLPWLDGGCAHATLCSQGSSADVGWMRRGRLLRDGTVIGWYPVVKGMPYIGTMYGDTSPADTEGWPVRFQKRYFKYKSRKRVEGWSLKNIGA